MNETVARDSGWASPSAGAWRVNLAETSDSRPPARQAPGSSSSSRGRVLVVEDDPTARTAVSRILRSQGFTVSEAGTIAQAMAALAQGPDWVLLDLMLPDGCGTQVLREARSEGKADRVCVVTGCAPPKVQEAQDLGAGCVLTKPLDVGRLLAFLTGSSAPAAGAARVAP